MRKIFLIAASLLLFMNVKAATEDVTLNLKGTGTTSDPYQVTSAADIMEICKYANDASYQTTFTGKHFKMMNDIDMSSVNGQFWGISSAPMTANSGTAYKFSGIWDGDNHRIKNMIINAVSIDENTGKVKTVTSANTGNRAYVGFFGNLSGAAVRNLIIDKSCSIKGYQYVAGIAGNISTATLISNCVNEANVYSYNNYAGGIAAYAYDYSNFTSGIYMNIINCVNYGNVYCAGNNVGGIIGYANYFGNIKTCANYGEVVGGHFDNLAATAPGSTTYVGGIVGQGNGISLYNCVNGGNITGVNDYVGGLAGNIAGMDEYYNYDGEVSNCVTYGQVQGPSVITGIVFGRRGAYTSLDYPMKITNVYYDSQLAGLGVQANGQGIMDGITGKTTSELTNGTSLTGLTEYTFTNKFYPMLTLTKDNEWAKFASGSYITLANGVTAASFSGTATVSSALTGLTYKADSDLLKVSGTSVTVGTPALAIGSLTVTMGNYTRKIYLRVIPTSLFDGAGTAASPYLIKTPTDLQTMRNAMLMLGEHFDNKYFRMENDIDLTNTGFEGIGTYGGYNVRNNHWFSGNFDGNNKTIKGFNLNKGLKDASGNYVTSNNGAWECVGFIGTLDSIGSVKNLTLDESCYISGYQYVGGIVGFMYPGAMVENCTFLGTVASTYSYIGGIVGIAAEKTPNTLKPANGKRLGIKNCFFGGIISADWQTAGGICGDLRIAMEGCLSAGKIYNNKSNFYFGGIVGYNDGTITDCVNFSTIQAAGYAGGIAGSNNGYYSDACGINRCFNAGLIMGKTTADCEIVGNVLNNYTTIDGVKTFPEQKATKAAYFDSQLANVSLMGPATSFNNGYLDSLCFHPMITADITNGVAIDSLPNFYFEKGYYPIPVAFKDNKIAKERAAVFMTFPEGQTVKNIRTGADINTAVNLNPRMAVGTIFKITDNRLYYIQSDSVAIDTVILTIGSFEKKYPVTMMAEFLKGTGTEEDPWQVRTVSDMNKIADYVTVTRATFSGEYFKVFEDIDYEGASNKPIGTTNYRFLGIFDGDNHTIKNVKVKYTEGVINSNQGLFAFIGREGVVKNLKVSNFDFTCCGISGLVVGEHWGILDNVSTDANCSINGYYVDNTSMARSGDAIGGIVGYLVRYGKIYNCENRANVTGHQWVGGIVGNGEEMADGVTRHVVENCVNYGKIVSFSELPAFSDGKDPANSDVGGILGCTGGYVTNCINYGDVMSTKGGYYVGGITGYMSCGTQMKGCFNYGDITSSKDYAGGLVGWAPISTWLDTTSEIDSCGNYGNVQAYNYAGGLLGQASTRVNVHNSFNEGNVTATHSHGAGIVGIIRGAANQTSMIESSYNSGKVTSELRAGGIVGYADATGGHTVSKCFNVGDVFETIKVDSVNNAASGIANGAITIQNSYNTGNVKGWNNVAGILGIYTAPATGTVRIAGAYNTGSISSPRTSAGIKIANITPKSNIVSALCYAIDTNEKFADDDVMGATIVSPIEFITKSSLPAAFAKNELCFPMLVGLDDVDAAKANAAYFDGSTDEDGCLNADINLASLDGVEWSSNYLITVSGNTAKTAGSGIAELTATCGNHSKTYRVKVDTYNSVDQLFNDLDDVIEKQFFTLDGIRLAEPRVGAVNVVVYITKDGKKEVKKVYIKK